MIQIWLIGFPLKPVIKINKWKDYRNDHKTRQNPKNAKFSPRTSTTKAKVVKHVRRDELKQLSSFNYVSLVRQETNLWCDYEKAAKIYDVINFGLTMKDVFNFGSTIKIVLNLRLQFWQLFIINRFPNSVI